MRWVLKTTKTCPTGPSAYTATTIPPTTSTTVSGLAGGSIYCFTVAAVDGAGNASGLSNIATARAKR